MRIKQTSGKCTARVTFTRSDIFLDDEGRITSNGETLKKYMEDLLPCAYPYLKDIVKDINEKKLPYVMSIEGGFCSGKTYFVTRLCQYIKDTKKNAIYFYAFEYDDTEPKIAILSAIAKDGIFKKIRQKLKQVSANINTGIGFSIPLNKVLFKKTMDEIRNVLEKEIQKSGRLVLIIDELDRCDSSFCKDLLETIKHFFDLDGLFIILSFSCEALSNAFKYIYGLDFINTKAENYLTKFIDHRTEIYSIESDSYKQVINKFFCDNKLRISENELSNITDVFADMHLTMREVIRCVEKIIILINTLNTKENISLYSYIAYRYDKDFEKIKSMKFIDDNSIVVFSLAIFFLETQSKLYNMSIGIIPSAFLMLLNSIVNYFYKKDTVLTDIYSQSSNYYRYLLIVNGKLEKILNAESININYCHAGIVAISNALCIINDKFDDIDMDKYNPIFHRKLSNSISKLRKVITEIKRLYPRIRRYNDDIEKSYLKVDEQWQTIQKSANELQGIITSLQSRLDSLLQELSENYQLITNWDKLRDSIKLDFENKKDELTTIF